MPGWETEGTGRAGAPAAREGERVEPLSGGRSGAFPPGWPAGRAGVGDTRERGEGRVIRELLSPREVAALPRRVRDAIARHQESSEILIGWIQLGVLLLFAILYGVSPKTFDASRMFAPVPVFLAAYLGVTLVRLALALARRLPNWAVYASVVVDLALLYGLIWSFHVQYQQPPAFYLKAPTLLYVFIFIAIRALRFQVRFVALAGVVAALGWIGT